jgi:hypothetical protein
MSLFLKPAPWSNTYESKVGTLENMFRHALSRTTSKQDAARLVQNEYAPVDVRFHEALRAGHDVGKIAMQMEEGNLAAGDIFKKR